MKNTIVQLIALLVVTSCGDTGLKIRTLVTPEESGIVEYGKEGPYDKGTLLSLNAVANEDYYFQGWSGDLSDSSAVIEFIADRNMELEAHFGPLSDIINENVVQYVDAKVDKSGLVFMIQSGLKKSLLVDKKGNIIKTWEFDLPLGNDLEILPDGRLFGLFKDTEAQIKFGGSSGIIRIINMDGSISWEMKISDENQIAHHDVELLPNGNVLAIVWERITPQMAKAKGVEITKDIFPEKLIEIDTSSKAIVWQWRSWDHIIQNGDAGKPNYQDPAKYPEKINILYNQREDGDWMHINGCDHDPKTDLIYLSVNYYGEVWVVDHSTTSSEATGSEGGNYNKGGDLIYRFGNPEVFNDTTTRLLFKNHHPSIIADGLDGAGNFLIYNNGSNNKQSSVFELKLPDFDENVLTTYVPPTVVWTFTDKDLFYERISGATRLPNGNTLICEGDFGYWEVTKENEVVWKYYGLKTNYWRGYYYQYGSENLTNLGI